MARHLRKANGEFNGSIGAGKTKTPKPGLSLKRKIASAKQLEIDKIESDFHIEIESAQKIHNDTLVEAKKILVSKLEPRARKLFDKYGSIQDFDEVKGLNGFIQIPSIPKSEYDLARALARVELFKTVTPAILKREKGLTEVVKKYPKKPWFK